MLAWLGKNNTEVPLFLTIPHSGETIPPEASWLAEKPELLLLTDVDRFVDRLYAPAAGELPLPALMTRVHRYVADLNRYPGDVDEDSVEGASVPSGEFTKGFHWVATTTGQKLMSQPIARILHEQLVRDYHDTFHREVERKVSELRSAFGSAKPVIYHLDCHSMPSVGTGAHADAGKKRADVVISDQKGVSASEAFKDLVLSAFVDQGFEVSYNWPYVGGRITQRYGQPSQWHETIQIELNRALYMNEQTREPLPAFDSVSARLQRVLERVVQGLK